MELMERRGGEGHEELEKRQGISGRKKDSASWRIIPHQTAMISRDENHAHALDVVSFFLVSTASNLFARIIIIIPACIVCAQYT